MSIWNNPVLFKKSSFIGHDISLWSQQWLLNKTKQKKAMWNLWISSCCLSILNYWQEYRQLLTNLFFAQMLICLQFTSSISFTYFWNKNRGPRFNFQHWQGSSQMSVIPRSDTFKHAYMSAKHQCTVHIK